MTETAQPKVAEITDVEFEDEDFEMEEVLENPGLGEMKNTIERITIKKVVFSGLGLATPMIVPNLIARVSGHAALAEGIIGLVVGFLAVILGMNIISNAANKDDYLTGGIAGVGVKAFSMFMEFAQTRMFPAAQSTTQGLDGAAHQMYVPESAGIEGGVNNVISDLANINAEVVAPTFAGIEAIGSGVYRA